jgi:rhodanese-related sulfurtransferase
MLFLSLMVACSTPPDAAPSSAAGTAPTEASAKGTREDTDIAGMEKAIADGALVVDVRSPGEWKNGHVPGVKHLALSDLSVDAPLFEEHGTDEPIYLLCEVGGRSARAADMLAEAGYHAVNVRGGTRAWREAGKPLEMP